MNYVYRKGTTWGKLTIEACYNQKIMVDGMDQQTGEKKPYWTGDYGPEMWDLRCTCGDAFSLFAHAFPGRRKMNSCAQCALHAQAMLIKKAENSIYDGPKDSGEVDRKRVVQIYIALGLEDRVRAFASTGQLSFSKAASLLLDAGLRALAVKEKKRKPWQVEDEEGGEASE